LSGDEYRYLGDSATAKTANDVEQVLQALHHLAKADAAQLAHETGVPESTVRRHLYRLLEQGLVEQRGLGRKGSPHTWRIVSTGNDLYVAESIVDKHLAA
jgi:predicted ArsR family transcriptional regulator